MLLQISYNPNEDADIIIEEASGNNNTAVLMNFRNDMFFMAEDLDENSRMSGAVMHLNYKTNSAYLGFKRHNDDYGPRLSFKNGDYLNLFNINNDSKIEGIVSNIFWDGSINIFRVENNNPSSFRIGFSQGLIYIKNIASDDLIKLMDIPNHFKFNISDFAITPYNPNKKYIGKLDPGYGKLDIAGQTYSDESDDVYGYGIINYNKNSKYFGHIFNNMKEGVGVSIYKDHYFLGKHTKSLKTGIGLQVFDDSYILGTYYSDTRDGVFIEINNNGCYVKKIDYGNVIYPIYKISSDIDKLYVLDENHNIIRSYDFMDEYNKHIKKNTPTKKEVKKPTTKKPKAQVKAETKVVDNTTTTKETNTKNNNLVDINSLDFKNKMKPFKYSVEGNEVIITGLLDDSIERLTIPEGVTKIAEKAFYCEEYLISVIIPSSVREIGASAFAWCTGLKTIVNSAKIEVVKSKTFDGNDCNFYYIPDTVKKIERQAIRALDGVLNATVSIPRDCVVEDGAITNCKISRRG